VSRRALAVLLIGAGALFVVLGSLFPLYGMETVVDYRPEGPRVEGRIALTGWEVVQEPPPPPQNADTWRGPVFGYGLVAAAVLAAVGAGLQLRSPRSAAIGRFGVVAGLGLVVGTLWAALEILTLMFGGPEGSSTENFVGAGTWIIGGAALVMLVGAVLAQDWPPRVPRPTGTSVYQVDDDDTPPFGIAIPVGELDVPADGTGETGEGGDAPPDDDRRHPTGGNPSTVD
jgi:hypothetical protein